MHARPEINSKRIAIGAFARTRVLPCARWKVAESRDRGFLLITMLFEHDDKRKRRKFTPNKTCWAPTSDARRVTASKLSATHAGVRLMANDQDFALESLARAVQMSIQPFRHLPRHPPLPKCSNKLFKAYSHIGSRKKGDLIKSMDIMIMENGCC